MTPSVGEFARLASVSSREREGFEATQVIESSGLRIEALVRRSGLRSMHVEYKVYQNPWTELEEALSGHVEFVGDDLCGFGLHCDGQATWVYDPSANTAIKKHGCQLFEPIPGIAALGELAFLDTLTQDFLLRDLGEDHIDERDVRRIGLKPKQTYRSHLLSAKTFPIRSATIALDAETYFPMLISFVPSAESPASSIAGINSPIRISYKDVQVLDNASSLHPFLPPADARVFEETRAKVSDLDDLAPFAIQLNPLLDREFGSGDSPALLTIDATNERAFVTTHLTRASESSEEESPPARLTLCVGNYVSRNMARRRATFSEFGSSASRDSTSVALLDRTQLWEQRLPGIDTQHAPVEAFFEKDSVFWFLSGTGMELDMLETLAEELLDANNGVPLQPGDTQET
ncbi:hypothetical protein ACFLSG_02010 [Candidatus Bipolaricaulota bacterium]